MPCNRELATKPRCLFIAGVVMAGGVSAAMADEPVSLDPVIVEGEFERAGLRLDADSDIGSRLDLPVEELPGSVDVIDQQRMQQRGNRDTTEAVTGSTAFSDNNTLGNLSGFSARGFTDVAILYDGISLGRPGMFARPQGIWIYERVETISGPASVLHGEGSIVGAVNYVPRRPTPDATETDILLSTGSFNSSRVAAGRGGPTTVDGLSYRIDGERRSSDGYADNAAMRQDTVSASLLYDASDRLALNANLVYLDDELPPYSGMPADPDKGEPPSDLARRNANPRDASAEGEELRFTLDADYLASASVQLRNRFQYYEGERDWVNVEGFDLDADGTLSQTFAFSLDHDQTFVANRSEALIDHDLFGRDARSVVGLQLSRDDFNSGRSARSIDREVEDPTNPGDTGSVKDIDFDRSENVRDSRRDTVALFGENHLRLGGGFSVLSGLRAERIRLDLDNVEGGLPASASETFTTENARLGFIWETTPTLSLFGQASTGSQFQLNPNIPSVDDLDLKLQRSTGFELGVRGRSLEGTGEWQFTVFDIEKRNRLVSDPTDDDPDRQRQVGRQTSRGVELSGYWEPSASLALEANATVLDAELRGDADFGGNTPSGVPEKLANLWATWAVTPRASVQTNVRYVGEQQANNNNDLQIPSYTLLNLSASYSVDHDLDITARARNITDERYYTAAWFGDQYFVGDGRAFEIELTASF